MRSDADSHAANAGTGVIEVVSKEVLAVSEESIRRSGVVAILAGVLLMFLFFLAEPLGLPDSLFFVFAPIIFLLLIWSLAGLRAAQGGRDGAVGKAGFWIAVVALIILLGLFAYGAFSSLVLGEDVEGEDDPAWVGVLLAIGFFGTLIGLLVFGIAMIRTNLLPRLAATLFTIGLPLGVLIDIATGAFFEDNGDTQEVGLYIGPPLFVIGLIWLGYTLWRRRMTSPPTSEVTT